MSNKCTFTLQFLNTQKPFGHYYKFFLIFWMKSYLFFCLIKIINMSNMHYECTFKLVIIKFKFGSFNSCTNLYSAYECKMHLIWSYHFSQANFFYLLCHKPFLLNIEQNKSIYNTTVFMTHNSVIIWQHPCPLYHSKSYQNVFLFLLTCVLACFFVCLFFHFYFLSLFLSLHTLPNKTKLLSTWIIFLQNKKVTSK